MKLDLMQRAQTHISDKLSKVLTESYQKEKEILGAVQVSATAAAKIKGLPSALAEVNRVIRAAQTLEQKKRRWHLYRAAREEIALEIDAYEFFPGFVSRSRERMQISGATRRR